MFHLIRSVIVGFVVGLCARALLPGTDHLGFVATSCVGIVGSIIGEHLGHRVNPPQPGARFHGPGFIVSVIGAIILLVIVRQFG